MSDVKRLEPVRELEGVARMGLARRAQGARRRRCRCTSLTTSNAAIVVQPPCALWVPAWKGHLLRWRSSTMCTDIACVAPPCICPFQARNAAPSNSRTGSKLAYCLVRRAKQFWHCLSVSRCHQHAGPKNLLLIQAEFSISWISVSGPRTNLQVREIPTSVAD